MFIYGASGSVGSFAVQLAKFFETEVTGVCSSSNVEMVKSLGVDKFLDFLNKNFFEVGEKYDIIIDAVGKILTHFILELMELKSAVEKNNGNF